MDLPSPHTTVFLTCGLQVPLPSGPGPGTGTVRTLLKRGRLCGPHDRVGRLQRALAP